MRARLEVRDTPHWHVAICLDSTDSGEDAVLHSVYLLSRGAGSSAHLGYTHDAQRGHGTLRAVFEILPPLSAGLKLETVEERELPDERYANLSEPEDDDT